MAEEAVISTWDLADEAHTCVGYSCVWGTDWQVVRNNPQYDELSGRYILTATASIDIQGCKLLTQASVTSLEARHCTHLKSLDLSAIPGIYIQYRVTSVNKSIAFAVRFVWGGGKSTHKIDHAVHAPRSTPALRKGGPT